MLIAVAFITVRLQAMAEPSGASPPPQLDLLRAVSATEPAADKPAATAKAAPATVQAAAADKACQEKGELQQPASMDATLADETLAVEAANEAEAPAAEAQEARTQPAEQDFAEVAAEEGDAEPGTVPDAPEASGCADDSVATAEEAPGQAACSPVREQGEQATQRFLDGLAGDDKPFLHPVYLTKEGSAEWLPPACRASR